MNTETPTPASVPGTVECLTIRGRNYDLGEAVYSLTIDILFDKSLATAHRFIEQFGESTLPMSLEAQMSAANEFWTEQLASLDIDTITARTHLVHDGKVADWAYHFETYVVPVLVANNLPRRTTPVLVALQPTGYEAPSGVI